jgi:hypothetical protein
MHNNKEVFSQICLGTVIANILVYYLIEYMGAGFAIVCSYFSEKEKEEVGYLYQKTLGITFLISVVMTPVIYLSDKFMRVIGFGTCLCIQITALLTMPAPTLGPWSPPFTFTPSWTRIKTTYSLKE